MEIKTEEVWWAYVKVAMFLQEVNKFMGKKMFARGENIKTYISDKKEKS